MQEIQFLEFMGGLNLPQASPHYLICMCFIRISMAGHAQSACTSIIPMPPM